VWATLLFVSPLSLSILAAAVVLGCTPQKGTIGAVVGQSSDGKLWLRDVPDDLAAGKAGLREGDEILLIDGMDVRGLPYERVHQVLVGEVGETVKLTLVRGEEVLRVTLKRTPAKKRPGVVR
jgi:C-terminal processing protease CtpA/Prc